MAPVFIDFPFLFPSVLAGIIGTANGKGAFCLLFLELERCVPFRMPFRTDQNARNCLKWQPFWRLELRRRPVRPKPGISGTGTENGRPVLPVPGRNWAIYTGVRKTHSHWHNVKWNIPSPSSIPRNPARIDKNVMRHLYDFLPTLSWMPPQRIRVQINSCTKRRWSFLPWKYNFYSIVRTNRCWTNRNENAPASYIILMWVLHMCSWKITITHTCCKQLPPILQGSMISYHILYI